MLILVASKNTLKPVKLEGEGTRKGVYPAMQTANFLMKRLNETETPVFVLLYIFLFSRATFIVYSIVYSNQQ